MKLPVIIQHHTRGYVVHIPDDEFKEMLSKAKHVDRNQLLEEIAKRQATEMKKEGYEIPERWRKPVKKYSGWVYGIESQLTASAEGDTIEEVLSKLKSIATGMTRGLFSDAKRDWPMPFTVHEIEI